MHATSTALSLALMITACAPEFDELSATDAGPVLRAEAQEALERLEATYREAERARQASLSRAELETDDRLRAEAGAGAGLSVSVTSFGTIGGLSAWQMRVPTGTGSAAEAAMRFVEELGPALGIADAHANLHIVRAPGEEHAGSERVIRLGQWSAGLPVWDARAVVMVDAAHRVTHFSSTLVPDECLPSADPVVAVEAAARAALAFMEADAVVEHELGFVQPGLRALGKVDGKVRLAWRLRASMASGARHDVFVDALDGAVLATTPVAGDTRLSGARAVAVLAS